ncbi:hypothetical protein HYW76_04105 [Candidatus Pacearchaeota archaeon]|nr:hypothetical protein [Candidatus Pacearchaeota archaeon]
MPKKPILQLKVGDKILFYNEKFIVKKIEFSGKGVKQGKAKCRIEAENEKTKEMKVIIKLSNELLEAE